MIVAALLMWAATYGTYRGLGLTWFTAVSLVMSGIGVLAIAEAIVAKVELTDDAMVVTRLTGRRSYPRSLIVAIYSAKGTPTKVEVEKGKLIELPPVTDCVNSIRAWIKSKA